MDGLFLTKQLLNLLCIVYICKCNIRILNILEKKHIKRFVIPGTLHPSPYVYTLSCKNVNGIDMRSHSI